MALYMLKMGGAGKDGVSSPSGVIPAKAGIQGHASGCLPLAPDPAFAGVTARE